MRGLAGTRMPVNTRQARHDLALEQLSERRSTVVWIVLDELLTQPGQQLRRTRRASRDPQQACDSFGIQFR
jgi:hypothetical protein